MRAGTTTILLAAALSALPDAALSQDRAETPEAAAEAMMSRVRAGDWNAMAAGMHPSALGELRAFLDPLLAMPEAGEFIHAILGVASGDEAGQLSDRELFARFVRFAMSQDPEMLRSLETAELHVIGHIMEGDTAHVVTRVTVAYQGIRVSSVEVSSFRSVDGHWLGLLTGDISALANAIREAVRERTGAGLAGRF